MFGDSRALFTDNSNNNAIFFSRPPKQVAAQQQQQQQQQQEDMLTKNRIMNFDMNSTNNNNNNNSTQTNSGLLRFRSAPSSLFANNGDNNNNNNNISDDLMSDGCLGTSTNGFSVNSHLPPHYPRRRLQLNNSNNTSNNTCCSSLLVDSCGSYRMENEEAKMAVVSSIMRQNTSPPALLFSHLNSHSGYGAMRGGVGNYRVGNGSNGNSSPTASRLKSQLSFSSGLPSSLGMLSRISEIENENIGGANGNDETKNGSGNGNNQFYASEFPLSSWSNSLHFAENYSGLKREFDDDDKLFPGVQNNDIASRSSLLSHHLSLPKTSSEMAAMDKLLQYQDSVPCKIRAKRGCATHPRSIAERVRRTRISERMRKLQELVPHMDKQTNTADMLDLAVDYIKDLQKQFKTLSDNRANCKCSGTQKPAFH